MPVFKIHHVTKYEYDRPVRESINEIRLYPYQDASQETLLHEIFITGQANILGFFDYWGNKVGIFNLFPLHRELVIESQLTVRTTLPDTIAGINFESGFNALAADMAGNITLIELAEASYIKNQAAVDNIITIITKDAYSIAAIAQNCSDYIYTNFKYIKGITTIETTVDEILDNRAGVCQDFAHVMLHVLRSLKIPSRYVSGYICPNKHGVRGEGATHAWVEVYIPQYGWTGIDPTNKVWVTNSHVKLAIGRHFNDCSPIKGSFKGPAHQKLSVHVSISYEDGQTFEDLNNVNLEELNAAAIEALVNESFAAQQQ